MRPIPVMLALLLALSPGVAATQAAAPTAPGPVDRTDAVAQADERNTTAVLGLGVDPDRRAFDAPSASLGSAIAVDQEEFRRQLSTNSLDHQLEAADTVEKQKRILNRYRYRIENRIIALRAEERQATQAFSNGSISETEYLRTLAHVDSEAEEIRTLSDAMQDRAESVPRFRMETEADTLHARVVTLEGPVRDRILQALRGGTSTTDVYVETAESGVVLSTIVDGTHVREIVRTDRRNPGQSGSDSMADAQRAIGNQYPWAMNHSGTREISTRFGTTNVVRMLFLHSHGRLVVYYDGGTSSVFKEVQRKRLTGDGALAAGPTVTRSSNNVTLTVNRTYAGGPLGIRLANATGAPLDGEIVVDGERVGRTGDDGVVWTLGPPEQFQVSATHDGTTVNATATPHSRSQG